jgi:glycosyltransferase involved in cell wall biosynthesis
VLRVAIDVRELQEALRNSPSGGLGGPGRYSLGLVSALLRHDDITWLLVTDRGPVPERLGMLLGTSRSAGLVRVGIPGRLSRLRYGRFAWRLSRIETPLLDHALRANGAGVLHSLESPPSGHFHPVVSTLHDIEPATVGAVRSRLRAVRTFESYRRHAVVVCVSRSSAAMARDTLGLEPGSVIQCNPGLDDEFLSGAGEDVPRALPASRHFLHVGVLRPRKNPEGLLRGFAAVARRHRDVRLLCVGPYQTAAGAAADVRSLAGDLGVADRVELLGDRDDSELRRLYRDAVALVFPSFWEGFGLPVAEALAVGTPCVTSDRGGLPEAGGDLAIYVDPTDHEAIGAAMHRALVDERLRAMVRREGPRWARRFTWDRTVEQVLTAYATLATRTHG